MIEASPGSWPSGGPTWGTRSSPTKDAIQTLVGQLEEEPEGSWVALQGIGAIEPEVRVRDHRQPGPGSPGGPGLDLVPPPARPSPATPSTRDAALDALASGPTKGHDDAHLAGPGPSWPTTTPDAEVRDRANQLLGRFLGRRSPAASSPRP